MTALRASRPIYGVQPEFRRYLGMSRPVTTYATSEKPKSLPLDADPNPPRRISAPSRCRRLVLGLSASAGAAMVLLLAAELALRLVWNRPADQHIRFEYWKYLERDPELVYRLVPNVRVEYPRYGASFLVNSRGFRGPEIAVERSPHQRRVLVLGDSFAFGHGVGQGDCFAEVLAELLPNTEVVNLGVPGYNLRTELRYFERVGGVWRPDVVVLALCQNDVIDHGGESSTEADFAAPAAARPASSAAGAVTSLKRRLADHCRLYALVQQAVSTHKTLARAAVRIGLKDELGGFELLDDNLRPSLINLPPVMNRAWTQLEADLLKLRDAVAARGAELVVAVIPALQAVEPAALARSLAYTKYEAADFDLDQPYRWLSEFAEQQGLPLVCPLADFRAAAEAGTPLYLPGDLHFNAAGHRLMAEALRPTVEQALTAVAAKTDSADTMKRSKNDYSSAASRASAEGGAGSDRKNSAATAVAQ